MRALAVAFMLAAAPAAAQKAVMEGVAASRFTIKVDTTNARVDIDTTSYTGKISNVGLHITSNVVVDTSAGKDAVVIYATGSMVLKGQGVIVGTANPTIGMSSSCAAGFYMSTSTYSNGVLVGGGCVAVPSGSSGGVGIASTTYFAAGATGTSTVFSVCLATVTITTTGGPVALFADISMSDTTASNMYASILEDGKYVSPFTSTTGISHGQSAVLNDTFLMSFYAILRAPSAAAHSYCLTLRANNGTWSEQSDAPQFGAYEMPH